MSTTNTKSHKSSVFQTILNSCSAITRASLSCKTFENNEESTNLYCEDSTINNPMNIHHTNIKKEQEISKWLDEQIEDYKIAIIRQKSIHQKTNTNKSMESFVTKRIKQSNYENMERKKQKIQTLKQDLFDDVVQRDQEHLIIRRIQMAAASSKYISVYPPEQYLSHTMKSNAQTDDGMISQKYYLMKESLDLRDEQVLKAIQYLKEMIQQKDTLNITMKDCYKIKEKNYKLWNHDLKQLLIIDPSITNAKSSNNRQESSIKNHDCNDVSDNDASKELKHLNKKINLFKASYMCIIAAAGIDWYFDERLCQTMCKLED